MKNDITLYYALRHISACINDLDTIEECDDLKKELTALLEELAIGKKRVIVRRRIGSAHIIKYKDSQRKQKGLSWYQNE